MYCPKCGTILENGISFCFKCGFKLTKAEEKIEPEEYNPLSSAKETIGGVYRMFKNAVNQKGYEEPASQQSATSRETPNHEPKTEPQPEPKKEPEKEVKMNYKDIPQSEKLPVDPQHLIAEQLRYRNLLESAKVLYENGKMTKEDYLTTVCTVYLKNNRD